MIEPQDILNQLPDGAKLIGNNQFKLDDKIYELKIEGTAEVTPSPARQLIIDVLTAGFKDTIVSSDIIDDLSIGLISALLERFELTPRE